MHQWTPSSVWLQLSAVVLVCMSANVAGLPSQGSVRCARELDVMPRGCFVFLKTVLVQEALAAEGQPGQAGSESIGTESSTDDSSTVSADSDACDGADSAGGIETDARGSCGVSDDDGGDGAAVVQERPRQRAASRAAGAAAAVPACSVARSAAGSALPSAAAAWRHNSVQAAMSGPAGSVGGAPAQTAGGTSSQVAQRSKSRPAMSNNAFLSAAVALGQGSVDDVRELEDFVVADPDRDYLSLLTQRYLNPSESESE